MTRYSPLKLELLKPTTEESAATNSRSIAQTRTTKHNVTQQYLLREKIENTSRGTRKKKLRATQKIEINSLSNSNKCMQKFGVRIFKSIAATFKINFLIHEIQFT
ncbi:hypothetical protein HZS_3851 [Henneguya salminicola]|nr:hypothetical protein HZS_3851 [Henneguya salminicola]